MNTINEEDKRKIEERFPIGHQIVPYTNVMNDAKREGAEFGYHLRDAEIERLMNDLDDALDLKAGNGPTALSRVVQERDALKKQVEEKDKEIEYLKSLWDGQSPVRSMSAGNIFDGPK